VKFSYQARTNTGQVKTGVVEASSREGALSVLQRYGLYITFLSEVKAPFWQKRVEFLQKISKKDVVFFTRQLAIMLRSNIPVVESIETIARQLKKLNFRDQILKIAELVEGGDSLSRALSSFPDLFSPFYIGMVKSGEASGNVPESLDYLADYLERQQDFTSKVIMAIIYPAFVLAVFFGIMLLMGIVVIPRFGEIFAGMGTDLPFLTRLVIEGATFVKQHWLLLVFGLIGLGFCGYLFLKSRETKKALDGIVLDLPILGSFFKKFFLVHIALNLSTLISGGVPISHALEISSDVVGNNVYKKIILQTRDGVRAGQTISSILSAYPEQFPLFFVQMTVVGEKTGHLEKTLKNVVTLYQKEVDRTLEALIKFLEPALIIFLGILVALLAFALFVPLFQRGMLI
jgi:type IV pilus assembly protein PilC